jgi:hypothetical protein
VLNKRMPDNSHGRKFLDALDHSVRQFGLQRVQAHGHLI